MQFSIKYNRTNHSKHIFSNNILKIENSSLAAVIQDCPIFVAVDSNIPNEYVEEILEYADTARFSMLGLKRYDVSERTKNIDTVLHMCRDLLEAELPRHAVIVGMGGGVLLDICGVAASLFRRGVGFIRIPTTLLSVVDVGIGIKQGVNFCGAKNILGSFYPCRAVLYDLSFLRTLNAREIRSGVAEIIKIALVRDGELISLLEHHGENLLRSSFQAPADVAFDICRRAILAMNKELVGNEYEEDLRRRVDLGHSFSPTMEVLSNYHLTHGEAVGLDMLLSIAIAMETGRQVESTLLKRLILLYQTYQLPVNVWGWDHYVLYNALESVKKHRAGTLNLVVPLGIGKKKWGQVYY